MHDVLYRTAQEMRALAAPHSRHLHEAIVAPTEARRSRRLASVRAFVATLSQAVVGGTRPARAGGRS